MHWWIGLFVLLIGVSPLAVFIVAMMVCDIGWKGAAAVFGSVACVIAGPLLMYSPEITEPHPTKSTGQTAAECKRDSGRVETQSATCTCGSRAE